MPTVPPPPPSSRVVPKSGRAASSAEAGPAAAPPRGPGKQTTSGVFTLVEGGERAERTGAEPSGVSQLSWLTGAAAPATGRGRAGVAKLPRKRRQAFLAYVLVTLAAERAGEREPSTNDTRLIAFALKTNESAIHQSFSRARAQLGLAESRRGRPDEFRRRCEELDLVSADAVEAAKELRSLWRLESSAEQLADLLGRFHAESRATKAEKRAVSRAWRLLGVALDEAGWRPGELRALADALGLAYAIIPRNLETLRWVELFRKASSPWLPGRLAAWADALDGGLGLGDARRALRSFAQAAEGYREAQRRRDAAWNAVCRVPLSSHFARCLSRFLNFCT